MPKATKSKDGGSWVPPTHQNNQRKPRKPASFPKRALSGYFLWAADNRRKTKGRKAMCDEMVRLGAGWSKLSAAAKKPYNEASEDAREDYKVKMAAYKKGKVYAEWVEKVEDWKEAQEEE